MKRRSCTLALIASAFVVSAPASGDVARAANTTTNFATTVVIPMAFVGGGSAGFGIDGQTTDAYPRIGRATVDGTLTFHACNTFGCDGWSG
jgi:hypothetical protein